MDEDESDIMKGYDIGVQAIKDILENVSNDDQYSDEFIRGLIEGIKYEIELH